MPSEVTNRSTKGDYTKQGLAGLRAARPAIEALLKDSRLADLGVINPTAIRQTLDKIDMGGDTPWLSLDMFIATELWLRDLEKQNGTDCRTARPTDRIEVTPEVPPEPLPDTARLGMPPGVFMTTRASGAVAINMSTQTYYRLNVDGLTVVKALETTKNFAEALEALGVLYPSVGRQTLRDGATLVIRKLTKRGILAEGIDVFAIIEGSGATNQESSVVMTRQSTERPKVRLRDYPAALGGCLLALALRRRPFEYQAAVLKSLHTGWANRPTTEKSTTHMLQAIRRLSTPYLGRTACMESTLATVLAMALKRRRADLVLGVKTDPDRFHAWAETDGVPIRTAEDPKIQGFFEPIFRV